MRLIDPTKVSQTVERTEHGRNIRRTEHADGRVDAEVKVRAIRIVSGAPPSPPLVAAIAVLESATREYRVAKHSGEVTWIGHAKERLAAANARLVEVQ